MRLLEEEEGGMVPLVKWETRNLIPLAVAVALALVVLVVAAVVVAAVVVAAVVATFELTIGIGVVVTVLTVAVIVAVNKLVLQHVEAEASQGLFLADQSELAICI